VITRFLDAVAALDADELADCFNAVGEYFVKFPNPAIVGRENIRAYSPTCSQDVRERDRTCRRSGSTGALSTRIELIGSGSLGERR